MTHCSGQILRLVALAGGLLVAGTSCDINDPDEVQNSANFAVIRTQFFASRTSRVPVPGVRLIVEAPEDSQRPYNGPDVMAISGEDGVVTVRVFPGFSEVATGGTGGGTGGGGTGGGTTGPQNPLELPPALVFADVAVAFIYEGTLVTLIDSGLTVGAGRLYDLGSVYLDEFDLIAD
ncbi:MAG: hypothetical protein ABR559_07995 [Gemmatimonadota bacterium]